MGVFGNGPFSGEEIKGDIDDIAADGAAVSFSAVEGNHPVFFIAEEMEGDARRVAVFDFLGTEEGLPFGRLAVVAFFPDHLGKIFACHRLVS